MRPFRLRAVLFDFDGTLTRPGALDFAAVKRELGCPPDRFVLEWIEELPAGVKAEAASAALERFELAAADASEPNHGVEEAVRALRDAGVAVGVLTRNGRRAIDRSLLRFPSLTAADFDVIVTRDDGIAPKPAPDGVVHAAEVMGAAPEETLVVGDYLLDMQAGRAAGALTAYLANGGSAARDVDDAAPAAGDCDFVVDRLAEINDIVRLGLPLPTGKLPNHLLSGFLDGLAADPAVIVPPAVGEDVTALELGGAELLVAHGDPITLGGEAVGRAAVQVNANDIAAAGAEPRWLIATVLLPQGTTPSEALTHLGDLAAAAAEAGVTLAGGHTEVTTAVGRPVVSLTALGTMSRAELKDKRSARPSDRVFLTKALAIEGTALLAEELGERLRALGMSREEIDACRTLEALETIVPEARIARGVAGVHAMHDVTEGGLASALRELAGATGHGVLVHRDRVPVLEETGRVCGLLGADPLGLIASGSLLICCDPSEAAALQQALADGGIAATDIGELVDGAGVAALERGRAAPWPTYATDEAARLLSGPG